jgi:hypothetical protein
MKKILFVSSLVVLIIICAFTFYNHTIYDVKSRHDFFNRNIILLLGISLLLAAIYFYLFVKLFPKGWSVQRKAGKVLIPIVFFLVAIGVSRGILLSLNQWLPAKTTEHYEGRVMWHEMKKTTKGVRSYFITLFTLGQPNREIEVRGRIFDQYGPGSQFKTTFYTGALGVTYTRESLIEN